MKKNKVIILLILFPALILGCQAAVPVATESAPTSTPVRQELRATAPATQAAAVIVPEPTKTPVCAVISADEALHLRQDPDPNARVLAFMRSGEVVQLISTAKVDWWQIKRGNQIGYARSKYLDLAGCR